MRDLSCFAIVVALSAMACSDVDRLTAQLNDDDIDCGVVRDFTEDCAAMLECLAPAIESNCETAAHVQQFESDGEGGLIISDYFFLPSDDGACEIHRVIENKPDRYDWIGGTSYARCPSFTMYPSDTTGACRARGATLDACELVSSR